MNLKKIKLKNFTSYKEETINFEDFSQLSCIIGLNGAGKSSIIDAITTVLFNRARCTNNQASGLENLIALGEDSLEVQLDFFSDNTEYSVKRKRFSKGGQELELFIDGVDHTDKIKETQQKLDQIIKMDYDTFLDTVCIGQGESGRFMKKKPDERKEVFTQVLNLDKYEKLQDFAKEIKKDKNDTLKKIKEELEELNVSILQKNEFLDKIEKNEKYLFIFSNYIE